MPLTYVLSYQNIDANQAIKINGDDTWKIDFGTSGIGRLHFYAEPDVVPPPPHPNGPCHVNMAIDQLDLLFSPKLDLQFFDNTCDPSFGVGPDDKLSCTMNNSVVLCDERSLAEIDLVCSEFLGHGSLQDQFKRVIDLETQFVNTPSAEAQEQKHLAIATRRSLTFLEEKELFDALPNTKPPHNCTSVLCLKPKSN